MMKYVLKPFNITNLYTLFSQDEILGVSATIKKIKASKIFYCFSGRNAWYSTWAQKYSLYCMHLSIESAKRHAEERRVQGSVFYIQELPALELGTGDRRIFVTQINSSCPLREYRTRAVRKRPRSGKDLIDGARECYIEVGASLEGAVLSFDYDSRFWVTEQPWQNSVMVLEADNATPSESLKSRLLKRWRSKSFGSSYRLNWSLIQRSTVSGRSVLRIYRQSRS